MTGEERSKPAEGCPPQQNGSAQQQAPVAAPGTNVETLPRTGKQGDPSTAFLRAARAGQLEKVLEYLDSGVDINASNANGLNALHLAAKDGHLEIVRELLLRGAIVDAATKKGNTALHIASLAGQEEVVHLLVQRGASVNAQSQNGFTPLYMAAQENHDSVVKFLLGKGANQTLATEDGFTPLAVAMQQGHDKVVAVLLENDTRGKVRLPALHIAAKKDDCKAAALLLQNDHNPDVTSKSGFTPLHIAAHYGNDRIASLLYDKGADVNFAAKHNITPMHVAAKWGKIKMVNLLMSKGANIEAKTRDGLTPLHCAARSGHHEVVDILIEKGAPIGSKTKNGLAPLHMASQGDHVDAARILLYHRAPVDEVTVDYLTALHVAAHCGHVRVAKLLLDRTADPNARALNGFTPLHIACKKNRIKVVELLLKHKASIEATTESGLTPLHVASFMGCMNIVIYLLQHEASPDIPTVRGETPLHLAARANQTDIIRILLRNGAQVDARAREEQTPLHVASRLGNVDIVMLLLQHGADVDATTKDLYTPLHIAAKEGQEEVASVLLENGASLTATTKKGFTPLHLAAKYGNMNVARLLLQKNAPVDAQGKNGVTPLHVASHYDHQNVALLLLDKGASPHAMAKNGHTPLHIAARKNQMDIATTLLEYGAKANAESKAGFTPLHLSAQEGHTDMSTLLIEHKADTNHKAKNGLTPLHLCAQEDKVNVASILVKNGAQIDAKTKAGYTPLHVASHFGQAAMVRFLLSSGASVDSSTSAGYTPLHQAAQQGHTIVINLLLESKAQPNTVTNNGQTALDIAQKLGYISVVETLKIVTETVITTTHTITIEEKYRVQAPESMQETFMSDSEDEGGGDEIGMAAMNVYGQPPHAQHVYLPSYYQGQMTYTREDPMLSDQQQYRYMTGDDMKSMGDDSMRVNVTDDERDNRHSGAPTITEMITKESYHRQNAANLKPDNVDIHRHPVHVGASLESLNTSLAALGFVPKGQGMWRDRIPSWRNFLVSFLVDARGGAMRGCRHSGVRVIVPPRKATMPMRVTCRYLKRDKLSNPPPLMEGEALASRILELGPVAAKFLGPVIIEVPHFASLRGKEREIVILRSDNGETWREHTLEASEEAVQDVLNESFEGEELSQLEDLQTSRIVRILTVDFPHYFAVVSRIRQEVHAVGPEGGTVSSSAVPQVQAIFPAAALTKKIRVGLQAHPIPAELVAKLLGNRVAVSPIVTVEPRRRKFHKPIILTIPVPQAANKGMINQYSGDAPTLRLLCSITGGQSRAVWEDVTGSTPLTFVKDCVSFTTTVSARFWLMDCRNVSEATKMATELYTHATHVPFMAKFVVFAKRVDPLEARLRVFCMTDDKEDKTLEHQEHFTEVAKSRDVEVLEGKTQYLEFAGNLIPVLKSGEQLQLPFRAFKENRIPFTVRIKDPDAVDMIGRIMFMNEPKVPKGEPPQTPICTLNTLLPDKISPEGGNSELDLLELSKNYSFLRDGGLSRPDAIHRATIRLTDIANLLDSDWEKLALELNVTPNEISQIKEEHPNKTAQQATAMFKFWQSNGNKATGNTLEKALNKIGREDIVKKCIFNVELVTDDVEKAVARVRLDQPGFDSLKEELGPSRNTSLRRDATMDPKMDPDLEEPDQLKDSESTEDLSNVGGQKKTKQHITITNGTVYNATSTPIKDKYASDEKELGDMMADFIEHKYHTTDTMVKKSRDEIDDDNKKRQRVLADANRIVSGIKQDAEKEMGRLTKEGWSVVCDDDVRKNDEVGYVIKQQEYSLLDGTSGITEPPIVQQQCIVGANGDRTVTTITTRTVITTGSGMVGQDRKPHDLGESYDTTDFSKFSSTKSIGHAKLDISDRPRENTSFSSREKDSKERKEVEDKPERYNESFSTDMNIDSGKQDDFGNGSKKSKDKSIFSGIFKTSKLKKNKSRDSKDISFESGDEESKVATVKLLDDMRKISDPTEEHRIRQLSQKHITEEFDTKDSVKEKLSENLEKEKSMGLFSKFKSPKLKDKSKSISKDKKKRYNNEISLDSEDEESKRNVPETKHKVPRYTDDIGNFDLIDADEDKDNLIIEVEETNKVKNEDILSAKTELDLDDQEYKTIKGKEKRGGIFGVFRSPKVDRKIDFNDSKESVHEEIRRATENFLEDSRNAAGIIDACPYKSQYLYQRSILLEKGSEIPEEQKNIDSEDLHDTTKPVIKKGKGKTGFLSGIFKGVKHPAGEVAADKEEFVEDTEQETFGEKNEIENKVKKVDDVADEVKKNLESPIASRIFDDSLRLTKNESRKIKDEINTSVVTSDETYQSLHDIQEPKETVLEASKDTEDLTSRKTKEKTSGFFTGIFKGAKHAVEEVTDDVREFVDETRLEALAEEDKAKKNSKKISENIQDSAQKTDQETENRIKKSISKTPKNNAKITHNMEKKTDTTVENVVETTDTTIKSSKERAGGFLTGLLKSSKHPSNDQDDMKIIDDRVAERIVLSEGASQLRSGPEHSTDIFLEDMKATASHQLAPKTSETGETNEPISLSSRNKKNKKGGFLTGIFKSVKHSVDDIADDVEEFVDESKQEAKVENEKAKKAAKKMVKDVTEEMNADAEKLPKVDHNILPTVDGVSKDIDTAGGKVSEEISDSSKKMKGKVKEIKDQIVESVTDAAESAEHLASEAKKESIAALRDSKDSAEATAKKAKEKTGGFLSGIFKGAKHIADEVSDEVKEFVDETKLEALEEEGKIKKAGEKTVKDVNDVVEEVKQGVEIKTDQAEKELPEVDLNILPTVDGVSKDIDTAGKKVSKEISDSPKKMKGKGKEIKDQIVESVTNAAESADHLASKAKKESIAALRDSKESAETTAKKAKEKTGGFLSGIFKGAKHIADEVSDEVKEFVDETKLEALEEEGKIKRAGEKTAKDVNDVVEEVKQSVEIKTDQAKKELPEVDLNILPTVDGVSKDIDTAGKKVSKEISDSSKKMKGKGKEIKDQIVESVTNAAESADHLASKAKKESIATLKDSKESAETTAKKAKEKTGGFLSGIFKGAKHIADEVSDEVKEFVDETKLEALEEEGKIKRAGEKTVKDVNEVVEEVKQGVKIKTDQAKKELPDVDLNILPTVDGVSKDIDASGKKVLKEISYSSKKMKGRGKEIKDQIVESVTNAAESADHQASEAKKESVAALKDSKESAEATAKKAKEKTGGFLSGIFKGAKHIADEVSDEVKEFVDETKLEALEEESKIKRAGEKTAKDVNDVVEEVKQSVEIKTDQAKKELPEVDLNILPTVDGVNKDIDAAGKKVSKEISDSSKKMKGKGKEIKDQIVESVTNAAESADHLASEAKKESIATLKDSKDSAEATAKKAKEKTGGFLSGIFKGAKHIADEVSDEVKEFVDETKYEALKEKEMTKKKAKKPVQDVDNVVQNVKEDIKIETNRAVEEFPEVDLNILPIVDGKDIETLSREIAKELSDVSKELKNEGEDVRHLLQQPMTNIDNTAQDMDEQVVAITDGVIDMTINDDRSTNIIHATKDFLEDMRNTAADRLVPQMSGSVVTNEQINPSSPSKKDKKSGFLTGILKGAEHAAGEVDLASKDTKPTSGKGTVDSAEVSKNKKRNGKKIKGQIDKSIEGISTKTDNVYKASAPSSETTKKDVKSTVEKKKQKSAGFLSGILKGAKHAAEEVADDVREFVEKTEQEASVEEEKAKKTIEKSAGNISNLPGGVLEDGAKTIDKKSNELLKAGQKVRKAEKLIVDELDQDIKNIPSGSNMKRIDANDSTETSITEGSEGVKTITRDMRNASNVTVISDVDSIVSYRKENIDRTSELMPGVFKDSDRSYNDRTDKAVIDDESAEIRLLSISAKQARVDFVSDSDDIGITKKLIVDMKDTESRSQTSQIIKDSPDKTDKNEYSLLSPKKKNKKGGFLSGILKSEKHSTEQSTEKVSDKVKEFVDESQLQALKIKKDGRKFAEETARDVDSNIHEVKGALMNKTQTAAEKNPQVDLNVHATADEVGKGTGMAGGRVPEEIGNSSKKLKEEGKKIKDQIQESGADVTITNDHEDSIAREGSIALQKDIKDAVGEAGKKGKEKTGGFITGIFKGVKHIAEEVSDEVKEFVDETKLEALEEGKAKKNARRERKGVDYVDQEVEGREQRKTGQTVEKFPDVDLNIHPIVDKTKLNIETSSKKVSKEISDSSKKMKGKGKEIEDQIVESVTNAAESANHLASETKKESIAALKDSKDSAETTAKKAKEKTGGFLSGIFKGAKHIADEVSDEVKEFVDETKLEALEEEGKIKRAGEKTAKDVDDVVEEVKQSVKIETDQAKKELPEVNLNILPTVDGVNKDIDAAGKKVSKEISDSSKKMKGKGKEIKDQIVESVTNVAESADHLASEAKKESIATLKDSKDTAEATAKKAKEKTGGFLSGIFKGTKHIADEVSDEVKEFVDETKLEALEEEGKIKRAGEKTVKDVNEVVEEVKQGVKIKTDQAKKELPDVDLNILPTVDGVSKDIDTAGKKVSKEISDSSKKMKGKGKEIKDQIVESVTNVAESADHLASEAKKESIATLKDSKDYAEATAKKAKERTGGFLSGIFKGAKHIADEVSHEVKEFVDETKLEALEEEGKIKRAGEKTVKDVNEVVEEVKQGVKIKTDQAKKELPDVDLNILPTVDGVSKDIDTAGKKVSKEISDSSKKMKGKGKEIKDQIVESVTNVAESADHLASEAKKESIATLKDSKDSAEATAKKAKERTGGFLSGIFKGAKHIADEVSDEVKEFVDETKLEALEEGGKIKRAGEKTVKDVNEVVEEVKQGVKIKTDQAKKELPDVDLNILPTVDGVSKDIDASGKKVSKEISDSSKKMKGKGKEIKDQIVESVTNAAESADHLASETKKESIAALKDSKDSAETTAKKAKEKTGGFLSGIFKGAKHIADEVSDGVKEFVDETKLEAKEEESKIKKAGEKTVKDVNVVVEGVKQGVKSETDEAKRQLPEVDLNIFPTVDGVSKDIDTAGKKVSEEISDSSKKMKGKGKEIKDQIVESVTNVAESADHLASEAKKESIATLKDSKDSAEATAKKAQEKTGGFLSGIFKGAKHIADEVSDEVKEFVDETKYEASVEEEKARKIPKNSEEDVDHFVDEVKSNTAQAVQEFSEIDLNINPIVDIVKKDRESSVERVSKEMKASEEFTNSIDRKSTGKTGGFFSSIFKSSKRASEEISDDSKEFINESKNEAVVAGKTNYIEEKVPKDVVDSTEQTKKVLKDSSPDPKKINESKEKTGGFFSGIFKGSKQSTDECDDHQITRSEIDRIETDSNEIRNIPSESDIETTKKLLEDMKATASKSSDVEYVQSSQPSSDYSMVEKKKDKKAGFLSGILKGAKHAVGEVADEIKGFSDESKREAIEEGETAEELIRITGKDASNVKHQFKDSEVVRILEDDTNTKTKNVLKNVRDGTESAKKGKTKAVGFLPGIFRSSRHSSEDRDDSNEKISEEVISEQIIEYNIDSTSADNIEATKNLLEDMQTNEQKLLSIPSISEKNMKKEDSSSLLESKKDGKGFFSGIFKSTRHAADEVKELAGETKQVVVAGEEKVKDISHKTVKELSNINDESKEIINVQMDDISKDLSISKQEFDDPSSEGSRDFQEIREKVVGTVQETYKIVEDINATTIDDIHKSLGTTSIRLEDTVHDAKNISDRIVPEVIESTEYSFKQGKHKTGGFLSGLFKGAKRDADEIVGDVREIVDETKQESVQEEKEMKDSAKKMTGQVAYDMKQVSDMAMKTISEPYELSSKNGKETSGFFSGILRGTKNSSDEDRCEDEKNFTTDKNLTKSLETKAIDGRKYVYAKDQAQEIDPKLSKSSDTVNISKYALPHEDVIPRDFKDVNRVYNQTTESSLMLESVGNVHTLNTMDNTSANSSVPYLSNDSPNAYPDSNLNEKTDSFNTNDMKTATAVFLDDLKNTASTTNFFDSDKKDIRIDKTSPPSSFLEQNFPDSSNKEAKKSKKSGVISNIVKKTKGATHKIVKEVDQATEGIKDATERFWEDTKREYKESKPYGSYDVTPAVSDTAKIRDEVALESGVTLESSNITDTLESSIPQTVETYHTIEKSSVQIVQQTVTIVTSDVSSSLSHSEPHAHQTVTTVITKSVRTAATPPPSPAEFTDNSSKDITEEAARQAQLLADHADSLKQPGHDSAEIDGTVERHASSTPTKGPLPASHHSTIKTSSDIGDLKLDLKNSVSPQSTKQKFIIPEPIKDVQESFKEKESFIITREKPLKKSVPEMDNRLAEALVLNKHADSKVPEIDRVVKNNLIHNTELHDSEQSRFDSSQEDNRAEACKDLTKELSSYEKYTTASLETVGGSYNLDPDKDVITRRVVESTSTRSPVDKKQDSWRPTSGSGEAKAPADLWDTQFPVDISPGSGTDEIYVKNGSSRQGTISDTDSDGSPQRRRRSQRRTLGSSSGSDVALHEGAELSPMEDDQENDLLQQGEPTFMETTTEIDPDTHERITRITRTMTTSVPGGDGSAGNEELRDSMQKIVDQFMTEERKGQ